MDETQWRRMLIVALQELADLSYQRRAWTGVGPEVSSPVEAVNAVFDDALLPQYVAQYGHRYTNDLVTLTHRLEADIDSLDFNAFHDLDELMSSLGWMKISDIAKSVQKLLSAGPQASSG